MVILVLGYFADVEIDRLLSFLWQLETDCNISVNSGTSASTSCKSLVKISPVTSSKNRL